MSGKPRTKKNTKTTKPGAVPKIEERYPMSKKELIQHIIGKKPKDKFLTENQKKFADTLKENQITICSGPAGSGKSHLALKTAIELISDPTTPYEKIIVIRPAIEGGDQSLGYLKGTLREKLDPYMYPTFYLLDKILGEGIAAKLEFHNIIEVMAISYIRGCNLDNCILVCEEFQNATPSETKLVLTRIGFNSKFFVTGDIEQSDKFKDKEKSGLYDAIKRLRDVPDIGVFEFGPEDIVRNKIITEILKRYDS